MFFYLIFLKMYYDDDLQTSSYLERNDKIDYKEFSWETIKDSYWKSYYRIYNILTEEEKSKWISFWEIFSDKDIILHKDYWMPSAQNYWYMKYDEYNIICQLKNKIREKKEKIINLQSIIAFLCVIIFFLWLLFFESLHRLNNNNFYYGQ